MKESICNAVTERFPLPAHIEACARAIRYDLFHGPSFSRIPAEGIEAFTAKSRPNIQHNRENHHVYSNHSLG